MRNDRRAEAKHSGQTGKLLALTCLFAFGQSVSFFIMDALAGSLGPSEGITSFFILLSSYMAAVLAAGIVIDRHGARSTMLFCYVLLMSCHALSGVLCLFSGMEAVIWLLAVLATGLNIACDQAFISWVPQVLPRNGLARFNTQYVIAAKTVVIAFAAFIVWGELQPMPFVLPLLLGLSLPTYAIAIKLISGIRIQADRPASTAGTIAFFREGVSCLLNHDLLRILIVPLILTNFILYLNTPFTSDAEIKNLMFSTDTASGIRLFLLSIAFVSVLCGAIIFLALQRRYTLGATSILVMAGSGLTIFLFRVPGLGSFSLLVAVLTGACQAAFLIGYLTLIQRQVPAQMLGRVFGIIALLELGVWTGLWLLGLVPAIRELDRNMAITVLASLQLLVAAFAAKTKLMRY